MPCWIKWNHEHYELLRYWLRFWNLRPLCYWCCLGNQYYKLYGPLIWSIHGIYLFPHCCFSSCISKFWPNSLHWYVLRRTCQRRLRNWVNRSCFRNRHHYFCLLSVFLEILCRSIGLDSYYWLLGCPWRYGMRFLLQRRTDRRKYRIFRRRGQFRILWLYFLGTMWNFPHILYVHV